MLFTSNKILILHTYIHYGKLRKIYVIFKYRNFLHIYVKSTALKLS